MDAQKIINSGKATINREIEGLHALSNALDANFVAAVECIANLSGKLIVTGMGKSGHIARKMAATFASTGTPAHFVHPAEASHGDLGMICVGDAVLMLSNSGETAELESMIAYTRRFGIKLIGIARRSGSTLVSAADIAVVLPETPEASPIGAPTTSTLMMLAYGDALAMALLERRGFTEEDFHIFHPGGKLGKGLLRVRDIMHQGMELPLVSAEISMQEVLMEITRKSFGCCGVIDEMGKLIGVITDGDLRRHMGDNLLQQTASTVMTRNPASVRGETLAAEAVYKMNERGITSLFVVDEQQKPIGIVHIHDCLRAGVA